MIGTRFTWSELQRTVAERLGDRIEARWMVEHVAGAPLPPGARDDAVPDATLLRLEQLVRRRVSGEPLQYVLGRWAFRTLDLAVDPRVLVPRPETEQLVDAALAVIDAVGACGSEPAVVVELGTGSGAVALSLAAERQGVVVWATDISRGALEVAQGNIDAAPPSVSHRVRLFEGWWWDALPTSLRGKVDVVVSNPPYIASREMASLDAAVIDWEPRVALESGPSGLEGIGAVLTGAANWLRTGGAAVLEISSAQATSAVQTARTAGFAGARVRRDLAGRDRILVAEGMS